MDIFAWWRNKFLNLIILEKTVLTDSRIKLTDWMAR